MLIFTHTHARNTRNTLSSTFGLSGAGMMESTTMWANSTTIARNTPECPAAHRKQG